MKYPGIFILLLLAAFTSKAQEGYVSKLYTSNDGLPASQTFGLLQDSRDFIWVGTTAGLSRFDGREFRNYAPMDGLEGAIVYLLKEDKRGNLWIGTSAGLFRFNGQHFVRVDHGRGEIKDILAQGDSVWMATKKGLFLYNLDGHCLSSFTDTNELLSTKITCLCALSSGGFLVGTGKGINKYDHGFSVFWKPAVPEYVMDIAEDHEKAIWFGTLTGGIYQSLGGKLTDKSLDTANREMVRSMLVNNKGELLISQEYGFLLFANGKLQGKHNYIDIHESGMYDAIQDREGNYWLSTNRGLMLLKPSSARKYRLPPEGLYGVHRFEGDTNVYASTCQNVYKIAGDTVINMFPGKAMQIGCIEAMEETRDGAFVIGTRIGDIRLYKNGKVKQLSHEAVWCSLQQGDHTWFGGSNGLLLLQGDSIKRYYDSGLKVNAICPLGPPGKFLLGIDRGLCLFDNGRYVPVISPCPAVPVMVTDICDPRDGSFLLATNGYGLLRVALLGARAFLLDAFTSRNGLNTDFIQRVSLGADGKLWLLTTNGVYCIEQYKTDKHIAYLNAEDGLLKNSWDIGDILTNPDSSVYVGGSDGLVRIFRPDEQRIATIPKTHLMGIDVNNRSFQWGLADSSLSFTGFPAHYQFGPAERSIAFRFSGIDLYRPGRVKYQYLLEGYEERPITTRAAFVNYNDLPPGDYVFKVRSTANQVFSNEPYTSFSFSIKPPFWNTWWFRFLITLLTAGVIYAFYRWRLYEQMKKQALQLQMARQLSESKVLAFQARMNPHFIFNSLNAIQYFMLNNDKIATLNYLSKFAKLLRQILDNSVESKINLEKEIYMLRSYIEIEELRFEKKFTYEIEIEQGLNPAIIEIPGMIIQPFVENAIIHGLLHKEGPGRLHIRFALSGRQILCTVEDNGIGRKDSSALNEQKATKHQSHGTAIAIGRLELLNDPETGLYNEISFVDLVENGQPAGTKVFIFIPIL